MGTRTLITIFSRDLKTLQKEIESFKMEENLWLVPEGINNSAGNLALHIVGNLNHYIGAVLGRTGYVRKRELEFSTKEISKEEILSKIESTQLMVDSVLDSLKEDDLDKPYPIHVFGQEMTAQFFLTHLTTHLSYHLGQINYYRRFIDG